MPNVGLSVTIAPAPPFPGPSQGRFRMARHQLTGGGVIAFQRSGVGDWVALLSKGFTQRHHQSTHFSFFRGRHGITMGEQGGYRDGVQGELETVKEKRIDKVSRSWSLHQSFLLISSFLLTRSMSDSWQVRASRFSLIGRS